MFISLTRSIVLTFMSMCYLKVSEPCLVRIGRFAVRVVFHAQGLTHFKKINENVRFLIYIFTNNVFK